MSKIFAIVGKLLIGGAGTCGGPIGWILSVVMFVWSIADIISLMS